MSRKAGEQISKEEILGVVEAGLVLLRTSQVVTALGRSVRHRWLTPARGVLLITAFVLSDSMCRSHKAR